MKKLAIKTFSFCLVLILSFCCVSCKNTGDDEGGDDSQPYVVPVVRINTQNVEINSKIDYVDMTFSIENVENALTNVTGGIRLRGNSTKNFPKKPYRIKFDSKQSLFGLEKAKSWVLLAEYLDPSGLRNYTAFNLSDSMPGISFTPTPHKVDVYLNGEYVGLYTLCEQVQENKGRMDIELDEITADMTDLFDFNFFISMDQSVIGDQDAVLDETYFYLEEYDRYFELKYPEKDQFVSLSQFNSFFSQLKEYVSDVMYAFETLNENDIRNLTNVDSLIDYLIVDQAMGEMDHGRKSFNMYYTNTSSAAENGKLNFGPVWDYDTSLLLPYTGEPNVNYNVSNTVYYSNVFFQAVQKNQNLLFDLKSSYFDHGRNAIVNAISEIEEITPKIQSSLDANHNLWYSTLPNDTTNKNIEHLLAFLRNRLVVLDSAWG